MPMRRKFAQPPLPNLYFKGGTLSVPGYTFEKAAPWEDTGSLTLLAEGTSWKDGTSVLAKIAPATGNASICLEREAHLLGRFSGSSEAMSTIFRFIDFISIPRDSGNCVVLLLMHPGPNILGRYFPPSKVNELLLADVSQPRPSSSHGDVYMAAIEDPSISEKFDASDMMDLASFLEFAIQATHCIEMIHKAGLIHREVRANAFHLNAHSGLVRFAHFGNRSVSLEQLGGPSALVIKAHAMEGSEKQKVKEALCYLAPEQTGSVETSIEDHRTDLYSIGIMFWSILVGQGSMPFEGTPLEILHAVAQKRPIPVNEVRRDVPHVLALMVEKLLAKSPDARYNSAYGLKADLMECQKRLLAAVSSMSEQLAELIPHFDIGMDDKYMGFTIPITLFGREKELETIRNVMRHISTSHARQSGPFTGSITLSSSSSQHTGTNTVGTGEDRSESAASTRSESSQNHPSSNTDNSPKMHLTMLPPVHESSSTARSPTQQSDSHRRLARPSSKGRISRTRSIVISGPAGAGKSSLIAMNQAKWRSHGLWGHAKFQHAAPAPFAALLACLSSVLRQLMVFQSDLHRFVMALKGRLGPQLDNASLLYNGAPELRDVLNLFDITVTPPKETLSTVELRVRFQALVEQVFSVLADVRPLALFLDDLHEADEPSLALVAALASSKSRMLLFASVRSDDPVAYEHIRNAFGNKSRVTCIVLEPLGFSAISSLVSRTLRRPKEECSQLSRLIHRVSAGNAFAARNLLINFQRHHYITFNWDENHWCFDVSKIEASLVAQNGAGDPSDLSYLTSHMRELPEDAKKYLTWASFFGATFKTTEVALMMDWEDSSGSSGSEDERDKSWDLSKAVSNIKETSLSTSRGSMRGLQIAIAEGWLVQRARDMCSFSHDKYRQAAVAEAHRLPEESIAKMSFQIVLMLMHDTPPDPHRIAEHAKRCIAILLEHSKRDEVLELLIDAGVSAWTRGAHELALEAFLNARTLLVDEHWEKNASRTRSLLLKLAELLNWKGDLDGSDKFLSEIMSRTTSPEDQAQVLRLQSRNRFSRNDYSGALNGTLSALATLGIKIDLSPTRKEADVMFERVKNEILAVGFDNILSIPRATDSRIDLAVQLLNDAGTNAYFSPGDGFADVIGLTTIQVALQSGMCPGTALGFFWALAAAAERRELYRFSADLGKLALRIADMYGTSTEKCRAQLLFTAMVSGYDNVHIRANVARSELVVKYGLSAGDRVYAGFGLVHSILTRLCICEHLSELVYAAEEALNDVTIWTPDSDATVFCQGLLCCIRALGGYTNAGTAETVFDTDSFKDSDYVAHMIRTSGNIPLALNWYNAFKVISLYCLGYSEEAAELGFGVYETVHCHPNHRHSRFAMCYHSLAMINCIRKGGMSEDLRRRYMKQIDLNQVYLRKWLSPSPINTSMWVSLVDAELAALENSPDAFKLYDVAVKYAVNNDWLLEEGWGLYLQGSHFVRCGVLTLGGELQRRGISRQSQWGAQGIVQHLTSVVGPMNLHSLKRTIFTSDVAVQTESVMIGIRTQPQALDQLVKMDANDEDEPNLSSSDLSAILQWSKDISSDINLSSALRRLTEIVTEKAGAQNACIVIAREAGDYTIATSMNPPDPCQVHENPKSIRTVSDPLQRAVIQHCLNSKARIVCDDASVDSRFNSEAQESPHRSVVCLPIFSNRGQTFGAVYLASSYSFSQTTVHVLILLLQQASISIANALLFRSVQAGTRENLKMIAAQRSALEQARRSREDALKATKIKSNFLASMSHELRTPFSSFYGLLDILGGTDLNPGQREIVQTAQQSCELLLKIIDSILDYSKLEASALKLEFSGFPVENIIADCMELLLPMAAKKLDMSFNIEPDVPPWVMADYARIRQVLMNLIGNGVKFTANGHVRAICSVDRKSSPPAGEVFLKFIIQDTGIGLSRSDVELLFVPFQQADNSSTRRFGGTGLGLSISRQLVKLMGGEIGVESELDVGSTFWFSIPVRIFESEESRKALADLNHLKSLLMRPHPLRVLVVSPSDVTRSLLSTMLSGFYVTAFSSIDEIKTYLQDVGSLDPVLDFIIIDNQSDTLVDDLAQSLHSLKSPALKATNVIHLYTPTSETLSRQPARVAHKSDVVKMTKPPRQAKLLQTLAQLKDIPSHSFMPTSDVSKAMDDLATAQRVLYGNVLIAEDNPVARQLLIKQLERYQLNVTATGNGNEAVEEWGSHEPGYFSVALFDHHMPICDGIEACKRIRLLENKRKAPISLPIIALSADCQESTKQLCLSAGMNAFLSKPLRKSDLITLLAMFEPPSNKALDGHTS